MTDPFLDPGEPGDVKSALRASDLINLPLLVRVTGEGEWPAREAGVDANGQQVRAQGPSPYVECDVVVLGASGIEDHAVGVRISWRRVVPHQLSIDMAGRWVPCRPKQQEDRSIILTTFDAKGKAKALELLPEIEELFGARTVAQVVDAFDATEDPY